MTTSPSASRPVARLRGPADIVAALPHLCGFVPTESLVVVALHGPRRRVRLTMRVDLPPAAHEEPLVHDLADRLVCAGAAAAVVVVCTDAADDDDLPRARLVSRLLGRLRAAGMSVDDAVLLRAEHWWSYVCNDERCCPAAGTPLAGDTSEGLSLVQAHTVLEGRAVLPSRDDLVASLSPPRGPAAVQARAACAAAESERRRRAAAVGRSTCGREALRLWRSALALARCPPLDLPVQVAAPLAASLSDCRVRDEVLTWALDDDDALLGLLLSLARLTPPPWDTPVCALLSWVAHCRGDGGQANVALDRALASQPDYALAALSRQALDGQVAPAQVRELLAESRRVLHATHPWTAP